jgi:L-ascorbate metabolism protein UlaG (beta-lactamase superfamily)
LGQAGFALRHANHRLLIDPYLSDHLARKYAGTEFPHTRMMPAPLKAGEVCDLDLVLCSHRHSDHTDPGSLATFAENNSRCRFVVPWAELQSSTAIGLNEPQLIPVNDGDTIRVGDSFDDRIKLIHVGQPVEPGAAMAGVAQHGAQMGESQRKDRIRRHAPIRVDQKNFAGHAVAARSVGAGLHWVNGIATV